MQRFYLLVREARVYAFRKGSRGFLLRAFMVVSVVLVLFTNAMASGIDQAVFNGQIYIDSGHVVLTWDRDGANTRLSDDDRRQVIGVVNDLEAAGYDSHMEYARQLSGQLSNSRSTQFTVVGIDFEGERTILDRGLTYRNEPPGLRDSAAIVSQRTVDEYSLVVGDEVVFRYQDASGAVAEHPIVIAGIFENGAPWQENHVFISRPTFEEWFGTQRSDVRVKVYADTKEDSAELRHKADSIIRDANAPLVTSTYLDEASQYKGFSQTARTLFNSMNIIVLIVLFIGIQVLIVLRLSYRQREFGVLRAIGHHRSDISILVMLEFAMMGFMSLIIGFAVAIGLVELVRWMGIPVTSDVLRYLFGDSYLRPYIGWNDVTITFVAMLAMIVLSVAPHAFHGRRLRSQPLN